MPTHHHSTHERQRPAERPRTDEPDGGQVRTDRRDSSVPGPVSRRRVLRGSGAVAATALAGCLDFGDGGDGGDAPDPVAIPEDATCASCGMVISQHPGPSAQIFYEEESPAGNENPVFFDSTWEAFQFDFEHSGLSREAFYVTDYSAVDYEIRTDAGQQIISRHTAADSFVDAHEVTFVIGSAVVGTMGKDLLGFSDAGDAEAFREDYGGDLGEFDDVTPEVVSSLGM